MIHGVNPPVPFSEVPTFKPDARPVEARGDQITAARAVIVVTKMLFAWRSAANPASQ
jgi:hypothetical protein